MGVDRRRAGFRLPWTADGEETQDAQDSGATEGADEAARAEMETPLSTDAVVTAEPAAEAVTETMSINDAANEPVPSEAATGDGEESTDFLANLVSAMRGVAESSRDASLAELRTQIDQRIGTLGTQASEREAELRRTADADIDAVGEWERTEIERIKGDAETKREERRTRLERELDEHRAASERAAEEARSRLAQHERELAAFFAQLGEITDPAAFVAAAKRMPRAPDVNETAPSSNTETPAAATPAMDPRLEALGVTRDTPTEPAEDSAQAAAAEPAAAEPAADAAGNGTAPAADARLAERLAQLDERLANASAQPATPATAQPGADTSTAIVVKGLGSFGAITSFKQSLERVEGIRGVTLSLGPTGEFVYRASHAGDFDVAAAIQTLEGPTATIEDTDGTLVVTLSRAR